MLVIFHCIGLIIFQILRNRKRLKDTKCCEASKDIEFDIENDLRFDPPVYKQRYSKVYETLISEKWRNNLKKLVDFGCAEFALFIYLKNLNIQEMLFVDVDESLLREKIGKLEPLLADHLRRRNCPLEVSVLKGSVADPDYRLRKTEVVTAIELIEHLYPDTLEAFPYNIFSFIKPKLVIITTPNADFNIMFGRLHNFRHLDHKFEWSREQFEDWASNIVQRFPDYVVNFCGIGEGPKNIQNIGCCSQAAIFTRKDIICEKYISPVYIRPCECDQNSPCKGQTTDSKMLCCCLCVFCLPDFSVGICTYSSYNLQKNIVLKKAFSDLELNDYKSQYNTVFGDKVSDLSDDLNPLYNIFYKLIEKIDYPFEIDTRSETEKLLQTFTYRIQTFSNVNSRFFVEERQRCEIPIIDIMYGDIDVSLEEVRHLLSDNGYQIKTCIISETGESECCIISMPQEMEDITSSSDVTDDYSSKSSECHTNFEANVEYSSSDWDETAYVPKEKRSEVKQGTSSSVDPFAEPKIPNLDPLFDSGYLKSPSPLETTNLQLPQDNLDYAETDHFEDGTTPNMRSDDNKLHLKKTVAQEKFLGPLGPMPENHRPKVDPNRINELDRFHNMCPVKTFMSNHFKPPNEFKKIPFKDLSMAGTSSSWKKTNKSKETDKKPIEKKDFEEPTVLDDAKSLTNCIIQNGLNRIQVECDVIGPQYELIRDLSPLREPFEVIEIIQGEQQNVPLIQPEQQDVLAPVHAVENGDLANNNRDNEGNNLEVQNMQDQDIDEGIDLLNDNLEDLGPLEDNMNLIENNNDVAEALHIVEQEQEAEGDERNFRNNEDDLTELEVEDSVAQASREVLFDVNSVQDLLEDFDIPPQANQDGTFDVLNVGNGVVLIGIHPISSTSTRGEQPPAAASIQANTNSFPNWLLQILGSHVVPDEELQPVLGSHDEPHFYCQGDGLGVHPSVIAVNIDEAEDADVDSTEGSSSNNTVDYAEVDPGPSEMFDMTSLPEESSPLTSIIEDNTLRTARSVVFHEMENDNNVPLYETTTEHPVVNYIADGTVNDLIAMAENEVRYDDLPGPSEPETLKNKCKQVNNSDSISGTTAYEEELTEGSSNTIRIIQCLAPEVPGTSEHEVNRVFSKSVVPSNSLIRDDSEQQNDALKSSNIRAVDSNNESEKSEYFDSRAE